MFTDAELRSVIVCYYFASFLNLIGSSFTLITFLTFKEGRNSATYLIFALALSDLCSAIGCSFFWIYLINQENNFYCRIQGVIQTFGLVASLIWCLNIGIYLFLVIYKNIELEKFGNYKILFHLVAWGYAAFAALLPFFADQYSMMIPQSREAWCWIASPKSLYRMVLYLPDTIIFISLTALYVFIQFQLHNAHSTAAKSICKKMNVYLLTYAVINTFAIINRVQNFISPEPIFILYLLHYLTQPLQGFANAIAYVWNEPVYVEQYKQLFYLCRRPMEAETMTNEEREKLLALVDYDNGSGTFHANRYGSVNIRA